MTQVVELGSVVQVPPSHPHMQQPQLVLEALGSKLFAGRRQLYNSDSTCLTAWNIFLKRRMLCASLQSVW
jgi:hypothetical protein